MGHGFPPVSATPGVALLHEVRGHYPYFVEFRLLSTFVGFLELERGCYFGPMAPEERRKSGGKSDG